MGKGDVERWRTAPQRVGSWILGRVRNRFGLDSPLKTDDRRLLEGTIIPFFAASPSCRRVLFVGCDVYTTHYERLFGEKEYVTIDKDPSRARYGAKRHVTAPLEAAPKEFAPGSFDLVIVNGVVGWGLDDPREVEASYAACVFLLGGGGVLLLGWNDTPDRVPVPLENSPSLAALAPFVFPPLGVSRYLTKNPNRHTFSFFQKRGV